MDRAALPMSFGEEIADRFRQTQAGVRDHQLHTLEAAFFEVLQEARPARLVLLGAFADAEDLAVAVGVDGDGNQQRHIPDFTGPRPFEHDAIEINIRVFTLDRPVPPRLDRRIYLLVEVRDRRR